MSGSGRKLAFLLLSSDVVSATDRLVFGAGQRILDGSALWHCITAPQPTFTVSAKSASRALPDAPSWRSTSAAKAASVLPILPGPIESRMKASVEEGAGPGVAAAMQEGFEATIPMNGYRTRNEVTGLVAFLASDDAGHVNGGAYPVDSSMTAA